MARLPLSGIVDPKWNCLVRRSRPATPLAGFAVAAIPVIGAFPDVHHHIEKLVTDGENVWVLYTMTGTHRGPLRGMQPTGKKVCYPIVAMYRISDGLIQEADFLSDDLRMMRQIGALTG